MSECRVGHQVGARIYMEIDIIVVTPRWMFRIDYINILIKSKVRGLASFGPCEAELFNKISSLSD